MNRLVERFVKERRLTVAEYEALLETRSPETLVFLSGKAREACKLAYGNKVFIRGLVEFTNYCRNDCYYCGLRKSNRELCRYRLTEQEILTCCEKGYAMGFRTFVLQGGEDGAVTDEMICDIVRSIKAGCPGCAVTLSIGEKSKESYQAYHAAGADRYLLRHESADAAHYALLHPVEQTLKRRMRCLSDLKEIGYQTGCGFMVGAPFQTIGHLARELEFLQAFQPEMVGIGPFLPHHATPFSGQEKGDVFLTLYLISLIRLILPHALIPATTALGTAEQNGRIMGVLCGANVVMPNLSPPRVRDQYALYDNKLSTGAEGAEGLDALKAQMQRIGYEIAVDRGDYKP